jgi:pimeloyl-ACP methyl ester carboxylesterase
MPDQVLHYDVKGEGEALLFLHGFMESVSMWNYIDLARLNKQTLCIDLPGHGKSPLEDHQDTPSIRFMAEKVMAVADFLGLSSYQVVGHSMGGYVALQLKEMDSRCQKVVLLHSNFWADSEQKKRDRIRMADLAFKAKERLVREAIPGLFYRFDASNANVRSLIHESLLLSSEAIAYASLAMRLREEKKELLEKFPNDFCIIQGANDPLIPEEMMCDQLFGLNVKYIVLKEAGHMGHLEDPEGVNDALRAFLS